MLTIVTPTLNAAATITRLLTSSAMQSVGVEHLIIDGGSTDETQSIVARFPHATWIEVPGSSIYEAQNIGIQRVGTEFYMTLTADDALYAETSVEDAMREMGECDIFSAQIRFRHLISRHECRQEGYIVRKSLHDTFGLHDPALTYTADQEFRRVAVSGGAIIKFGRTILSDVAFGGFSSRLVGSENHGI